VRILSPMRSATNLMPSLTTLSAPAPADRFGRRTATQNAAAAGEPSGTSARVFDCHLPPAIRR
jgi:hypothetical protein